MALETALNLKYMTGDGKPMVYLLLQKFDSDNYCEENVIGPPGPRSSFLCRLELMGLLQVDSVV